MASQLFRSTDCYESSVISKVLPSCPLSEACQRMPVNEFHDSTWYQLDRSLDSKLQVSRTARGQSKDWQGLAEEMNLPPKVIQNLEGAESKVKGILLNSGFTVLQLWERLAIIEREDILSKKQFAAKLEIDCQKYQERMGKAASNDYLVLSDVKNDRVTKFDAFLSFCEADINYAKEILRELENVYLFKICVNVRDLLPGVSTHFATAQIMAERCSKIIIIMSPCYLDSPECDFQLKVAQELTVLGMDKKMLIPVLYRECRKPQALSFLWFLEASSQFFWPNLTAALLANSMGGISPNNSGQSNSSQEGNTKYWDKVQRSHDGQHDNKQTKNRVSDDCEQSENLRHCQPQPQPVYDRSHKEDCESETLVKDTGRDDEYMQSMGDTFLPDVVIHQSLACGDTNRDSQPSTTDRDAPPGHPDLTMLGPNH